MWVLFKRVIKGHGEEAERVGSNKFLTNGARSTFRFTQGGEHSSPGWRPAATPTMGLSFRAESHRPLSIRFTSAPSQGKCNVDATCLPERRWARVLRNVEYGTEISASTTVKMTLGVKTRTLFFKKCFYIYIKTLHIILWHAHYTTTMNPDTTEKEDFRGVKSCVTPIQTAFQSFGISL